MSNIRQGDCRPAIVLGFGLSNEGDFRPEVKAGFAFVGEKPANAPPHIQATTPMLPSWRPMRPASDMSASIPAARPPSCGAVPLFLSDGKQLYPNLALEALRVAQGASTYVLAGATDVPDTITSVEDRRLRGAGHRGR